MKAYFALVTIVVLIGWIAKEDKPVGTYALGPIAVDSLPTYPPVGSTTVTISNDNYLAAPIIGDCQSYSQYFTDHGLPRDTFMHIAWVESGCNHELRHTDADDHGGGLLGFNFTGGLADYWLTLCGLTNDNLVDSLDRQLDCARKAYDEAGTEPWENSRP